MRFICSALFAVLILIFSQLPAFAEDKTLTERQDVSYCNGAFRGGYFFPENDLFRRIYGKWSNDIYYVEMGCYPIQNFLISGSVGGYYQRGHPIGEITGEKSGEDLTFTMVPFGIGASYRFRFSNNQPISPFFGGGYRYVFLNEDPDPGKPAQGWKQGPAAWGGALLLLDKLDPEAATYMKMSYSVEHTYLELRAEYSYVGEPSGLDLRGWSYMIGLSFDF